MIGLKKLKVYSIWMIILLIFMIAVPAPAQGEVQPITETKEKLDSITKEEQETLKKLFTITQEIEELDREEARISGEIDTLQAEIKKLDQSIKNEQKSYDTNLELMKQVLISYQRGGPASSLEILLKAKDLTAFLKSMNLIKDISKNTNELLGSIEVGKQKLLEEKDSITAKSDQLEVKKVELQASKDKQLSLKKEQEVYLASVQEQKKQYEEHLSDLKLMWEDLKKLFPTIAGELGKIINGGYFTAEDLNVSFSLFSVAGSLSEDTLNRILKEHGALKDIKFHFSTEGVTLEVPEKHLVLNGKFTLYSKSAITFEVESGSFYEFPLEAASIDELFKNGPLIIDFEEIAGDAILIDVNLDHIETKDGKAYFTIKTGFSF